MNIVTLIGNLATDVDLREVGPEKKVASFLLAVDRASKDGGADFVSVCAWDRQAELCAEYLGKGRRVAVDGWLKSRSWEEDGKRRTAIEVVARRVVGLIDRPRRRLSRSLLRAIPSSHAATEPCSGRYLRAAVSAAANTSAERSAASSRLPVSRRHQRKTIGR